jgi:cytochrome P450
VPATGVPDAAIPDTGYLPPMLNPFDPGFHDNPYEQYRAVREADPIHLTPLGVWALFRHADIHRVLRDPNLSVEERHSTQMVIADPEILALREGRERRDGSMLDLDPPDHHRLRRLVAKVFTPRMIEELRPRVEALVDEMLDAAAAAGSMDIISDLAFPLPFIVISEMLGVPDSGRRDELRTWSGALVKTFDPIISIDEAKAALAAGDNMYEYLTEIITWKRAHPGDDLLSAMIAAEEGGDRLTEDELISTTALLFIAGHETTVNLIGNGVLALLRNPDQLALLRAQPDIIDNAVDELLRYDGPVQFSRRITITDYEIGGTTIPAGTFVMVCLGSGNHDPEVFGPTSEQLDLTRPNAKELLTFGGGFHHCLGNALARLEGQVAIGRLVARFDNLALQNDTPKWNGRFVLRGLTELPVDL